MPAALLEVWRDEVDVSTPTWSAAKKTLGISTAPQGKGGAHVLDIRTVPLFRQPDQPASEAHA
ncbi:MAG TPA: hypothetical protein VF916_09265 [Ktedonobacterales bacterium]